MHQMYNEINRQGPDLERAMVFILPEKKPESIYPVLVTDGMSELWLSLYDRG